MSKFQLTNESSAPSTPVSGRVVLYALSSDKKLYYKDDTGAIQGPLVTGGGGVVGPANYVYLSPSGSDGTGTRGDAALPFGTIKGALAACQTGDVLVIGAGTYLIAAPADVPVWNPLTTKLTIVGAGFDFTGNGGTVIKNTIGDASHIFDVPNTVAYCSIQGLHASVAGTGQALHCDGNGAGGTYLGGTLNGSLVLQDCVFLNTIGAPPAYFRYVGAGFANNVFFALGGSSETVIITSNFLSMTNCTFAKFSIDRNFSDPQKPTAFLTQIEMISCSFEDNIVLKGQAQVAFHQCDMRDILGQSLTAVSGSAPRFRVYGGYCENIDFQASGRELPDTADSTRKFEIFGTHIHSSIKTKVAGTTNRWPLKIVADMTNINATNIIADQNIDFDATGSEYKLDGSQFVTNGGGNTGKIRVQRIDRVFTTAGSSPEPVDIVPGGAVTFMSAPDFVYTTPKSLAAGFTAATFYTATAFTLAYSVAGVADVNCSSVWK